MELPTELFDALAEGASFERGKGSERREAPRVQIAVEATLVRLGGGGNLTPMAVKVRDLSCRGVRLECKEEFHVWDSFALRFHHRDGTAIWIQCEVSRWMPLSLDLFSIGARFVKILNTGKPSDAVTTAA